MNEEALTDEKIDIGDGNGADVEERVSEEEATDTNCFGETSTYSTESGFAKIKFSAFLQETNSSKNRP